jgi:hypothetical protein
LWIRTYSKRVCFLCALTNWCATETRMNAFTFLASLSQLQFASAFDFPSHSYLDNDAWRKTVKRREKKKFKRATIPKKNLFYFSFLFFFSFHGCFSTDPSKQCNCVVSLRKRPSFAAQSLSHAPHN